MALTVTTGTGTASGGASTIVVTKPTGLAEGDLMIACIVHMNNAAVTGTGWSAITNQPDSPFFNTTDGNLTVLGKVATSGDAAASNFTFTSSNEAIGIIYRVIRSEGPADWPVFATVLTDLIRFDADIATASGGTVTFSGGVTPVAANSLLIMTIAFQDGSTNFSGYGVVTSDPTWTETANIEGDVVTSQTLGLASAYAIRSAATATGNYAANPAVGNPACIGCLISITESLNASVTLDAAALTATPREPTVTGGANVTLDAASMTATAQTLTAAASTPKWVNTDKSSAGSITNTDKS